MVALDRADGVCVLERCGPLDCKMKVKKTMILLFALAGGGCGGIGDREFFTKKIPACNGDEACINNLPHTIAMYSPEKVHMYYDAYKPSNDEETYKCAESCEEDYNCEGSEERGDLKCEVTTKCKTGDFGNIIEQPGSGMVFMQYSDAYPDVYTKEKNITKLFHKVSENIFRFAKYPEKDHEHIFIDREKQTATYRLESFKINCHLRESK
jgi:hypothetical protein